jgi:hypothetical protein
MAAGRWLALWCLGLALAGAQGSGYSLRFFGSGVDDVDRVKIRIDAPARPADVGGDFTLEWWMKARPGDNAQETCSEGNDNWIYGNIIFDRDIYGAGEYGDWGVSLFRSGLAFGVYGQGIGAGLCGSTDLADGAWHHVAVTRRASNGRMRLFVDGRLEVNAQMFGPTGDVSYQDGRETMYQNSDPFLVIGAEKHDAGPAYPSYSGWIDEVRLSKVVRYAADFTPPTGPFMPDPDTVALYHFDEGQGDRARDSSGALDGPSDGEVRFGGRPGGLEGPVWSTDVPWSGSPATPTATRTPTAAGTPPATPVPASGRQHGPSATALALLAAGLGLGLPASRRRASRSIRRTAQGERRATE